MVKYHSQLQRAYSASITVYVGVQYFQQIALKTHHYLYDNIWRQKLLLEEMPSFSILKSFLRLPYFYSTS